MEAMQCGKVQYERTQDRLYHRTIDKSRIPVCNILGVDIAAINMEWLLRYLEENLERLKGDYICVSNVHTTVLSYEDNFYRRIQNEGLMALPDGGPLCTEGQRRGFLDMGRIAGPDLMQKIFEISPQMGYKHFFSEAQWKHYGLFAGM